MTALLKTRRRRMTPISVASVCAIAFSSRFFRGQRQYSDPAEISSLTAAVPY
jgi:hypothetical protein